MSLIVNQDVLPKSWYVSTFKEIADIQSGFGFPLEYQGNTEGEIPFFKVGDISQTVLSGSKLLNQANNYVSMVDVAKLKGKLLPVGSVVFAKIGEAIRLNRRAILSKPSLVDNNVMGVKALNEVEDLFLYYYLMLIKLDSLAKATTVPSIRKSQIEDIQIPVPPLGQQKQIVAKIEELFSHIDAGIAALKKSKQLLKQYRQSVLKAAVTGELTKEWREQNKAKLEPASKLLERILIERRQKWEQQQLEQFAAKGKVPKDDEWKKKYKEPALPKIGELFALPEEWCWVSPEQISSTDKYALAIGPFGSNLKVTDYRDEGVPLVFVRNIRANSYGLIKAKFVTKEKAEELDAHSVDGGDILITKMGDPPGDAGLYPVGAVRAIITADCVKWRLYEEIKEKKLYVHFSNSDVVRQQVLDRTKGVAQKKITLESFRTAAFPFMSESERIVICNEVEARLASIEVLENSINLELVRSERLKQSVLQSAFGGGFYG